MMMYRVVLTNVAGMRLTLHVRAALERDAGPAAEMVANSHPDHSRHGPWWYTSTMRAA